MNRATKQFERVELLRTVPPPAGAMLAVPRPGSYDRDDDRPGFRSRSHSLVDFYRAGDVLSEDSSFYDPGYESRAVIVILYVEAVSHDTVCERREMRWLECRHGSAEVQSAMMFPNWPLWRYMNLYRDGRLIP